MELDFGDEVMDFSIVGDPGHSVPGASVPGASASDLSVPDHSVRWLRWFVDGLRDAMLRNGHTLREQSGSDSRIVFNITDQLNPRPFRRKAKATFVLTITIVESAPGDVFRAAYTTLVRSLSNMALFLVREQGKLIVYFVTLEGGLYPLELVPGADDRFFDRVYERVAPLATSHLVIDNEFRPDLPLELWEGDDITEAIFRAGKRLDALNLLPAMWPAQELLDPRDFEHVRRLYGIGGLSYGNVSARRDATSFWMSASGVKKSELRKPGTEVLLVKGFDPKRAVLTLSVPPNVQPRRVSVDCIEHWMIYAEHPTVGAIVHVHAWMEGVRSTEINYPCGTIELARAVAELVRESDDPSRAVVGLRNHGMTLTGPTLDDIFERIDGKVTNQVPMS